MAGSNKIGNPKKDGKTGSPFRDNAAKPKVEPNVHAKGPCVVLLAGAMEKERYIVADTICQFWKSNTGNGIVITTRDDHVSYKGITMEDFYLAYIQAKKWSPNDAMESF